MMQYVLSSLLVDFDGLLLPRCGVCESNQRPKTILCTVDILAMLSFILSIQLSTRRPRRQIQYSPCKLRSTNVVSLLWRRWLNWKIKVLQLYRRHASQQATPSHCHVYQQTSQVHRQRRRRPQDLNFPIQRPSKSCELVDIGSGFVLTCKNRAIMGRMHAPGKGICASILVVLSLSP